MNKTILHVTAGDDNWTPTQKEINALRNKFKRAMNAAKIGHTPVIVTRDGISARLVEFDHVHVVTSGYMTPVVGNPPVPPVTPGYQPYTIMTTTQGQQP
jgi:hypothetical protein